MLKHVAERLGNETLGVISVLRCDVDRGEVPSTRTVR